MSRPRLSDRILAARVQRTTQGRLRQRRIVTRRDGVRCEIDGRWLTNFSSNDYLGLSQQFGVIDALQAAAGQQTLEDTDVASTNLGPAKHPVLNLMRSSA